MGEDTIEAGLSSSEVGMLWSETVVQRLFTRMVPGWVPREVMVVMGRNLCLEAAAAEMEGTGNRTGFPLLLGRARQKCISVTLKAEFDVEKMKARNAPSWLVLLGHGN